MRIALTIIAVVTGILGLFIGIQWSISDKGVYINQEVRGAKLIDSTYDVVTYVWYNENWINSTCGEIQWAQYAYSVKCYNVNQVKAAQYSQARLEADKLKSYIKSVGKHFCQP